VASAAHGRSVQEELEKGIARLYGAPVRVDGRGRTDASVHARGQVASSRSSGAPLRRDAGLNALLSQDLACVGRKGGPPEGASPPLGARQAVHVRDLANSGARSAAPRAGLGDSPAPDLDAMRRAAPALLRDARLLRAPGGGLSRAARPCGRSERCMSGQSGARIEWWSRRARSSSTWSQYRRTLVEVGHGRREPGSLAALLEARSDPGRSHGPGTAWSSTRCSTCP